MRSNSRSVAKRDVGDFKSCYAAPTYIWSTYKQIGLSPTLYALMTLLILLTVALTGIAVTIRRA